MEKKRTPSERTTQKAENSRRSFLKKSLYAAPTLVAMGAMMKPTKAKAGFNETPSDPAGSQW